MFVPTKDQLMPDLTAKQELALLARTLWKEGYDDHISGHITYAVGDGTLWCTPWYLTWHEVRPEHIIRIDLEGTVLEGDWPAPLGIPLHLELHKARPDVQVALHNHSRFGTIWADAQRIPPVLDQSSALGGGDVVIVDEYKGAVNLATNASAAVDAMGGADLALLAHHGVFVVAGSIRAAHQRAVALEQRCRHAWYAEALGGGIPLTGPPADMFRASSGEGYIGFWEAMVRAELLDDPTLLSGG
jgi:ribulose-5-phosphate 4-epimerase/fuculose-1-phosphate aldolase